MSSRLTAVPDDLRGKTVLVTGATGFLGAALVTRLSQMGIMVRAMIRRPERASIIQNLPHVEVIEADLVQAATLPATVEGVTIVFHVGAALGGPLAHQRLVNVDGTRALAKTASVASIQRFVHVSSIAVYGYDVRGLVHEDHPQQPGASAYNKTKSEAERVLLDVADQRDLPFSIIRPGMIYGPRSRAWSRSMFRLARIRPTPFVGNGTGSAHPIFVDDVVDLLIHCATHPNASGEAFHCTPDPAPTWREFLGAYAAVAGHKYWLGIPAPISRVVARLAEIILRSRHNPQDTLRLVEYISSNVTYSMAKSHDRLSWSPRVSLHEGIERCIPYLREQKLL